jgi:hypothetical protein
MTKNTRKKRQSTRRMYKKTRVTRKRRGGSISSDVKNCKSTFLKKMQKERSEVIKDLKNMLEKQAREKFANNPKELKEKLDNIRKFTKPDKKIERITDTVFTKSYCNPGCKNTILEPGEILPTYYYEHFGKNKELIKIFEEQRKKIFGNKTDVLKDNFYEKAPKKYVDKIKKDGAISLCSPVEKVTPDTYSKKK